MQPVFQGRARCFCSENGQTRQGTWKDEADIWESLLSQVDVSAFTHRLVELAHSRSVFSVFVLSTRPLVASTPRNQ